MMILTLILLRDGFGTLHKPLLHAFNLSIQRCIFLDKLKITWVTQIFKGDNYNPCLFYGALKNVRENNVQLCL